MKTKVTLVLLLIISAVMKMNAQVTVGNDTPPAATLDVVATKTDNTTAEGIIAPRLTLAQLNAKQSQYGSAQIGAFVYITDYTGGTISGYSDQITCVGYAYFDGSQWIGNCASTRTYVTITSQPQPFSFYEQGTESEAALVLAAGGSSGLTYQWYIITGNNVHVRIARACTDTDGVGATTAAFIPKVAGSLNSTTTKLASKNGFYRYYCVVTNMTGDSATSDIAEVAVGCGAKDLNGEWLSFMCFNLGATRHTIYNQQNTSILFSNPVGNDHIKVANEEALYGDLYQWGRIGDGHEKTNKVPVGNMGGATATDNVIAWNTSSTPVYADGNILGATQRYPAQQVAIGSPYYGKFIGTLAVNDYNWYAGSSAQSLAVDQLWRQGAFPPNDPCQKIMADGLTYSTFYPTTSSSTAGGASGTGWRLPSQNEWASLYRGGTFSGSRVIALANTWDWYELSSSDMEGAKGMSVKPDGVTTTLFLPANGYRNPATMRLTGHGLYGGYWSASAVGSSAYSLLFSPGTINSASTNGRGYGFGLRCIKN